MSLGLRAGLARLVTEAPFKKTGLTVAASSKVVAAPKTVNLEPNWPNVVRFLHTVDDPKFWEKNLSDQGNEGKWFASVGAKHPSKRIAEMAKKHAGYDPEATAAGMEASAAPRPRLTAAADAFIAAAPELLEACKNLEEALADVINAAGNGQPYSAAELVEMFIKDLDQAHAAIAKAEGRGPRLTAAEKEEKKKKAAKPKTTSTQWLHCPNCGSEGPWTIPTMTLNISDVPCTKLSKNPTGGEAHQYDDTKGQSDGWDHLSDPMVICDKCKNEVDVNELIELAESESTETPAEVPPVGAAPAPAGAAAPKAEEPPKK